MDRTGVGGVCWPGVVSHVCGDARIQRLNQCDSSFHAERVSQASRYRLAQVNFCPSFSTIGRLITGVIADKYGRINTQTGLICLGALAIFTIWLPFGHTLPGLYVFSCVFGLASGSFLSLAPACIGQISKASEVGGRFGICYSIVSLA